ncbi:MAG: serine hydrolase, partial [Elusimicrobiota bacterium]
MVIFWLASLVIIAIALAVLAHLAAVGASYKAKVLCSTLFVSERKLDTQYSAEISAESYRILRPITARVDYQRREVTCSLLGFAVKRTAAYRPGLGATLLTDASRTSLLPSALLTSCVPTTTSAPWPEGVAASPSTDGRLARVLDTAFTEPDRRKPRRTRAIVIVKNGRILAERYAPGFAPGMPMCGWSMSKSVLHALVGIAVSKGWLSTDKKDLLPKWRTDARADIRIEDLLRMQSGLAFSEVYANPFSDVNRMLWIAPSTTAYAAAKPLRHAPGRYWSYASGTSNILGRVVRNAVEHAGEDWASFPSRALFTPLGMSSAILEPDTTGDFVFSSFLQASPRDWARFGLLYANDGCWDGKRLLPEGWVAHAMRPASQAPDACYGAHWWLKLPTAMGGGTAGDPPLAGRA